MGFFFKSPEEKVAVATKQQAPDVYALMHTMVSEARAKRPEAKVMMPAMFLELYVWYKRNSRYDPDKTPMGEDFALFLKYAEAISKAERVPEGLSKTVDGAIDAFYRACSEAPTTEHAIGMLAMLMAADKKFQKQS